MTIQKAYDKAIWLGIYMRLYPDLCDERDREYMWYLRSIILKWNLKQKTKK